MSKLVSILTIVTVVIGLVACTQQPKGETEKKVVTEQKDDHEATKEEDSPTQSESETEVPEDTVYQNKSFKDVKVTQSGDEVVVTGKARVFEGVFQYVLKNGENVLKEGNYQTDGAPAWGEFTITIPNELVTTNEVKLELFYYSAKDGSKMDALEVPISTH